MQNPLTSLSDDIDRTIKMASAQDAPTLLVGHAYGCAVITGAGLTPNVVGLVYLAGPALDEGRASRVFGRGEHPRKGRRKSLRTSMGFYGSKSRSFTRFLSRSRRPNRIASLGSYAEANSGALLRRNFGPPAWKVKPTWYQISTNDRLIPTETEKWMAERINAKRGLRCHEPRFRGKSPR